MSLAVVIPYRDRSEHLQTLLPVLSHHLAARHPDMPYRIHVVEQSPGKPFNRGAICNVGFALAREEGHEQVCFHDVDYVPVDADYSPVAGPTRLIWYGADQQHRYDQFFGAVTAFPAVDFARVNGFSNEFWGWGFEDSELRRRCVAAGLTIQYRDGTFRPLQHPHQGIGGDGNWTTTAQRNFGLLKSRWSGLKRGEVQRRDGLSSLRFAVLAREEFPPDGPASAPPVRKTKVAI